MAAGLHPRYPGSQPFSDTDLDRLLFLGRTEEARIVLHSILSSNLFVLYAVSGTGKTSLLKAAVMHELRDRDIWPVIVRLNDRSEDTRPVTLVRAHIEQAAADAADIELIGANVPYEDLWGLMGGIEVWRGDVLQYPILIFDQFEEVFTLWSASKRAEFVHEFGELARGQRSSPDPGADNQAPSMSAVISIREDSLGELEAFSDEVPQILRNRYRLKQLDLGQAALAIESPARISDERLASPMFRYDEGAVALMLDFLSKQQQHGEQVAADTVEAFQLQIICQHVEEVIVPRRLREMGRTTVAGTDDIDGLSITSADLGGVHGLERILEEFYARQLDQHAGKDKHLREVTRRLCEEGLILPSIERRLSLEQSVITAEYGVSEELLSRLVDTRLLRAEPRVGSVYYELAHDSLVRPILNYRRQKEEEKARKRRRLLGAASGLVTAAVIVVLLGVALASGSGAPPVTADPGFINAELDGMDFTQETDLAGKNFTGASLVGARFDGADLTGAIFEGADLTDADLSEVNLTNARMPRATLNRAELSNALLAGANLDSSNLEQAVLRGADFTNASLMNADMEDATFDAGTRLAGADLRGADLTDLSKANLDGVSLEGTNLDNANLSGQSLAGHSFVDATMRGANLANASLAGSVFTNVDLSNADLSGADLTGADLSGANLSGISTNGETSLVDAQLAGANFAKADLSRVDLFSIDMRRFRGNGANFSGQTSLNEKDLEGAGLVGAVFAGAFLNDTIFTSANLADADFSNAVLTGSVLRGANLSGANMSFADLSDANLRGADLSGTILGAIQYNADTAFPDSVSGADLVVRAVVGSVEVTSVDPFRIAFVVEVEIGNQGDIGVGAFGVQIVVAESKANPAGPLTAFAVVDGIGQESVLPASGPDAVPVDAGVATFRFSGLAVPSLDEVLVMFITIDPNGEVIESDTANNTCRIEYSIDPRKGVPECVPVVER